MKATHICKEMAKTWKITTTTATKKKNNVCTIYSTEDVWTHSWNRTTCHKIEEIIICIAQTDGRYERVQYHYGKILFKLWVSFLAICYIIEGKSNVCSHIHKQIYKQATNFQELFAQKWQKLLFLRQKKSRKMRI